MVPGAAQVCFARPRPGPPRRGVYQNKCKTLRGSPGKRNSRNNKINGIKICRKASLLFSAIKLSFIGTNFRREDTELGGAEHGVEDSHRHQVHGNFGGFSLKNRRQHNSDLNIPSNMCVVETYDVSTWSLPDR